VAVSNGFKIRPLNVDCDKLAVQSSEQTTWLLGFKKGATKTYDVGILRSELIVLRPYGGCPAFEIAPQGEPGGVLLVDAVRTRIRAVRVGAKIRVELGLDETCVIRREDIVYPGTRPTLQGTPGHAV
jgi:hypothetical protein